MRNAPVVVATVSQRNCTHCQGSLPEEFPSQHFCPSCGLPQPLSSSEDYFTAFGVPRKFAQKASELEKRFYQVSRALHPDRFTGAHLQVKNLSLERMSFLNQAYQVLKSPKALRTYLLELEGIRVAASGTSIPTELAESWFEIQESLMESEDSASVQKKLQNFEEELRQLKTQSEQSLVSLGGDYDLGPSREILEKMAKIIQTQAYLNSLEKDVERIKKNANPN